MCQVSLATESTSWDLAFGEKEINSSVRCGIDKLNVRSSIITLLAGPRLDRDLDEGKSLRTVASYFV